MNRGVSNWITPSRRLTASRGRVSTAGGSLPAVLRCATVLAILITSGTGLRAQQQVASLAAGDQTLRRLSIEELGKIDVTSASKHAEPVGETAGAVSVVTGEDIRRAGVTELPEALRLAAGVAVARFNGETWGVSARGFNISSANKMLVLIDGRTVYTPLFSGVFWGVQDVVLEDVDRIEVIRGPGAALWGANAVNGVINIITKTAEDTPGGLVVSSGGTDLGQAVVQYGGKAGTNSAYRVYGKYSYYGPQVFATGATAHDRLGRGQTGFRIDWTSPSRTTFTLQGDAYDGQSGLSDRPDIAQAGGNLLGRLSRTYSSGSQLQFQWYFDRTYRNVPRQFAEHRNTYDLDLQYRFTPFRNNEITAGGGYRLTQGHSVPSTVLFFDPAKRTSPLSNVFIQDEVGLVPRKLVLTLGSKFENNDYTGFEYEPSARIRWSPNADHTTWGAVSRAVRMPTRFDTDLRFTGASPIVVIQGNPSFKSEDVIATEVGYRVRMANLLAVDVAGFVNRYDDLRTEEPAAAAAGLPITLANNLRATTGGVEIGLDYQPLPQLQFHGAYTRLAEDFRLAAGSRDASKGTAEHNDPQNQFSFRSYLDLPHDAEVNAVFRLVGALPAPVVPRYSELTLTAGWGHSGPLELLVIGDNLLHEQHGEAAATGTLQEQYLRRMTARLTWHF